MNLKCETCGTEYNAGPCDDYDSVPQAHSYEVCIEAIKRERDEFLRSILALAWNSNCQKRDIEEMIRHKLSGIS